MEHFAVETVRNVVNMTPTLEANLRPCRHDRGEEERGR